MDDIANETAVDGGGDAYITGQTFSANLPTAAARQAVGFAFATADGTATAGSDYTATTTSGSIAAGALSTTVSVPVLGDTVGEADEVFYGNLSSPTGGATVADAQGDATIVNDDAITSPTLTIN